MADQLLTSDSAEVELNRAVELLRTTIGDGKACVAQQFGGAAGGQQVDALGREALSKLKRTALVGKADESLADFHGAVS